MESLGEYLKEARIKSNLSIAKIAEDTHIVKKFIEAIDEEEFSVFPGEAYLKGFLRTYSDYLGIDSDVVIKKYEKIKMVETPPPMDQLIPKQKLNLRPIITIFLLIIILAGAGTGGFFGIKKLIIIMDNKKIAEKETKKIEVKKEDKEKPIDIDTSKEKEIEKKNIFETTDKEKVFNNLKKDEVISVSFNDENHSIIISQISPTVILNYSNGKALYMIHNYQHKIDLNNDENNELEVVLNYWDKSSANITFKTIEQVAITDINAKNIDLVGENPELIITKDNTEKIVFSINVTDDQFIRYKIDDNDEVESVHRVGSNVKIQANNFIILWLTNTGITSLNFTNYNKLYSFNQEKRVDVKLIKWEKNSEGAFDLKISSLK